MSEFPKDRLGNEIKPGVVVAFATGHSSSKSLKLAKVEKVEPIEKTRWAPEGRVPWIDYDVTVRSARSDWKPGGGRDMVWGKAARPSVQDMIVYPMSVEDVQIILGISNDTTA